MRILILSSKGYSGIGWATTLQSQQTLADLLSSTGLDVEQVEVDGTSELDALLNGLDAEDDVLIWPNAYYVSDGDKAPIWLTGVLEARQIPFVGSPASSLETMLHKDKTQIRLAAMGIPIPRFATVTTSRREDLQAAMEAAELSWPVVIKATSTAGSLGIHQAEDMESLQERAEDVLQNYGPRILVEEFLPSTDLTVGALIRGDRTILMPTWYEVATHCQETKILDVPARLIPWGAGKRMRRVVEPDVLEQIEGIIPKIVKDFGIRDLTRIDGRIDRDGRLRIFDVNGMPGLEHPESVILQQVMEIWQEKDGLKALKRLACSLAAVAGERNGMELPAGIASYLQRGASTGATNAFVAAEV